MKSIKNSSIIICGIVRNAERGLLANIPIIKDLCSRCHDYRVAIFENDSCDETKRILKEWAQSDPVRIHAICTDSDASPTIPAARDVSVNPYFSRRRIERMCRLRNQYLDYVDKMGWSGDFLLVVDLDVACISLDGVLSSFDRDDWDAVTAFGYSLSPRFRHRYHDTYALVKWGEQDVSQTETKIIRHADELGVLKAGNPWVRVYSAFGGMAIYRYKAVKGLRYDVLANSDPRVEVHSEHVGLYRNMVKRGYDKFYINPAMKILYQRVTLKIAFASACRFLRKILKVKPC